MSFSLKQHVYVLAPTEGKRIIAKVEVASVTIFKHLKDEDVVSYVTYTFKTESILKNSNAAQFPEEIVYGTYEQAKEALLASIDTSKPEKLTVK